jgi:hypothetical protein
VVTINRTRVIVLGFLALLTVGSFAASSAFAEPGPFWHQRPIGGTGNGIKIDQPKDDQIQGEGGEQKLRIKIASLETEINAKSVQIKGVIYNAIEQGQLKLLLKYHEPKLVKPVLEECETKIGTNNEIHVFGHLMWKYRNVPKELEEQPQKTQEWDLVYTPVEIAQGAEELPKGVFTTITLSGSGCGVLAGKFNLTESILAIPLNPKAIDTFTRNLETRTPAGGVEYHQHFWNGARYVPVQVEPLVSGNKTSLEGRDKVEPEGQEVAVFPN